MPTTYSKDAKGPEWWKGGKDGYLSPWAQSQVFALVKISQEHGPKLTDSDIAEKVWKVGGGHPSHACIAGWRKTFEKDPEWYPGKSEGQRKRPGRMHP